MSEHVRAVREVQVWRLDRLAWGPERVGVARRSRRLLIHARANAMGGGTWTIFEYRVV